MNHPAWRLERQGPDSVLHLSGDWIARETGVRDLKEVHRVLAEAAGAERLRFEVGDLGRWDSSLIAFVQAFREAALTAAPAERPSALDESGLPHAVHRLLLLASEAEATLSPAAVQHPSSVLVRVGRSAISTLHDTIAVSGLVGHVVLRAEAALTGRLRSRKGDMIQLMSEAGGHALGIVAIVNALVGGILAFVGAVQLRRFGTQIFVADLVGISMAREMAAMITAIVMAGRTRGAYAAQIATMQGSEEIDALKAIGIPVHEYLILPRVLALVAMMPLLYAYACAIGLLGGFAVSLAKPSILLRQPIFERPSRPSRTRSLSSG